MFKKKTTEKSPLDIEIATVQTALATKKPVDEDYNTILTHLERLYALKELEKPESISPDTKANVAANLIGIAMIVAYENSHVITTKALTFAMRLK